MKKLNEYIKSPLIIEELMNVKGGIVGGTTNPSGSAVVSSWGGTSSLNSAALISISIVPINTIGSLGLADCQTYACTTSACNHFSCTKLTCETSGCKTKMGNY